MVFHHAKKCVFEVGPLENFGLLKVLARNFEGKNRMKSIICIDCINIKTSAKIDSRSFSDNN